MSCRVCGPPQINSLVTGQLKRSGVYKKKHITSLRRAKPNVVMDNVIQDNVVILNMQMPRHRSSTIIARFVNAEITRNEISMCAVDVSSCRRALNKARIAALWLLHSMVCCSATLSTGGLLLLERP